MFSSRFYVLFLIDLGENKMNDNLNIKYSKYLLQVLILKDNLLKMLYVSKLTLGKI